MEDNKRKSQTFRLGNTVKILSGPFNGFRGKIEGINKTYSLLKVKLIIFGRDEPVKLNFLDVVNLSNN
jgi:transcription termination/antitermination protein NusG